MLVKMGAWSQRALQKIRFLDFQVTINPLDVLRPDPELGANYETNPFAGPRGAGAQRCWKRSNYETKPNSPADRGGYYHPVNPGIGLADGGNTVGGQQAVAACI